MIKHAAGMLFKHRHRERLRESRRLRMARHEQDAARSSHHPTQDGGPEGALAANIVGAGKGILDPGLQCSRARRASTS